MILHSCLSVTSNIRTCSLRKKEKVREKGKQQPFGKLNTYRVCGFSSLFEHTAKAVEARYLTINHLLISPQSHLLTLKAERGSGHEVTY